MSGDEQVPATQVGIVIVIEPFLMRTGVPFTGDVHALAEQMTRYVADNVSRRFTADHDDAGLLVITTVKRGEELGAHEFRERHYVKPESSPPAVPRVGGER